LNIVNVNGGREGPPATGFWQLGVVRATVTTVARGMTGQVRLLWPKDPQPLHLRLFAGGPSIGGGGGFEEDMLEEIMAMEVLATSS